MSDRFDSRLRLARVGVHRAPERKRWRWWMTLLVCCVSVVVLTVGGIVALELTGGEELTPSEVAVVQPLTDPSQITDESVTITVIDGTAGGELGPGVDRALLEQGWPVVADGVAETQTDDTVVFYASDDLEPIALGLVETLGVGSAQRSDEAATSSPITIVLGNDAVGIAPSAAPAPSADPTESVTP